MGSFFYAFSQADFFGKLIFLSLFTLSSLCWIFLIHKILLFKKVKKEILLFKKKMDGYTGSFLHFTPPQNHFSVQGVLAHPFLNVFTVLKNKLKEILDKNIFFSQKMENKVNNYLSKTDVEMIDSHIQIAITKEKERLEKNLFILSLSVTLAPFLGLLGTVWGILITFGELQQGNLISSNKVILGGLSTALTTTVLGLLIAIPALVSYNYLKNKSHMFLVEMCDFAQRLVSTVELEYRVVDA